MMPSLSVHPFANSYAESVPQDDGDGDGDDSDSGKDKSESESEKSTPITKFTFKWDRIVQQILAFQSAIAISITLLTLKDGLTCYSPPENDYLDYRPEFIDTYCTTELLHPQLLRLFIFVYGEIFVVGFFSIFFYTLYGDELTQTLQMLIKSMQYVTNKFNKVSQESTTISISEGLAKIQQVRESDASDAILERQRLEDELKSASDRDEGDEKISQLKARVDALASTIKHADEMKAMLEQDSENDDFAALKARVFGYDNSVSALYEHWKEMNKPIEVSYIGWNLLKLVCCNCLQIPLTLLNFVRFGMWYLTEDWDVIHGQKTGNDTTNIERGLLPVRERRKVAKVSQSIRRAKIKEAIQRSILVTLNSLGAQFTHSRTWSFALYVCRTTATGAAFLCLLGLWSTSSPVPSEFVCGPINLAFTNFTTISMDVPVVVCSYSAASSITWLTYIFVGVTSTLSVLLYIMVFVTSRNVRNDIDILYYALYQQAPHLVFPRSQDAVKVLHAANTVKAKKIYNRLESKNVEESHQDDSPSQQHVSQIDHHHVTTSSPPTPQSTEMTILTELLKRKKLELLNVSGDGACLFHALSDQIHNVDSTIAQAPLFEKAHLELRQSICTALEHRWAKYGRSNAINTDLRDKYNIIDAKMYIANMRKSNTYGTHVEISEFARMYNCRVVVYSLIHGDTLYEQYEPATEPISTDPNSRTYRIALINSNHYMSVRLRHKANNEQINEQVDHDESNEKSKSHNRVEGESRDSEDPSNEMSRLHHRVERSDAVLMDIDKNSPRRKGRSDILKSAPSTLLRQSPPLQSPSISRSVSSDK